MPIISVKNAALILLLIAAIAGFYSSKLTLLEDISAMLPDREDDKQNLVDLAREAGLMERVVVVVGPGAPGSPELFAAMDAAHKTMSNLNDVKQVIGKLDTSKARNAAMLLLERSARLYRQNSKSLEAKDVAAALESLKKRLASPEALVMQPYFLADPLGFSHGALMGLEAAGGAMGAKVEQGRLFSKDGRYGFIIAKIGFDPFEVERSAHFVDALDRALKGALKEANVGNVLFFAIGGVHFAAASAGAIRADVTQAFVLTCIGVALIFGLFFRRLRIVPVALLPGGVGVLVAAGLMGAAGVKIHGLTLGFSATITGISVDYVIHLLFRASRTEGDNSRVRIRTALKAILRPLILGCVTTVAAFLLVATSNFPGMRQLALFSSISVPVALLVTLFLIPAFHRTLVGESQIRTSILDRVLNNFPGLGEGGVGRGRILTTIAVFAVISSVFALFASRVQFSGDPHDMGYFDDVLTARMDRLKTLMPAIEGQELIVTTAAGLDDALYKNDVLFKALMAAGIESTRIISVSPFFPSLRTQDASVDAVKKLFDNKTLNLQMLFKDAGFSDKYFQNLKSRLESMPLVADSFKDTGLMRLIDESVHRRDGGYAVLTRVSAKSDDELAVLARAADQIEGCALLSERGEAKKVLEIMQRETTRMLMLWIGVAFILISLVQRSAIFGLRSLLPAIFGVVCAAGIFGLLGRPMTPVATAGLTLVMGLGIDYGIFMQNGDIQMRREAAPAVFASALTTLIGFGVLAGSRTMAMADLGLIILVGVSAAVAAALMLVPAAHSLSGSRGKI